MPDVRTIAFVRTIKEQLFARAGFVLNSTSHDAFVNDDKVRIPQAGTIPSVEEDRSSYPIAVTTRTDDQKEYDLIEFSLGALRVPEKDMVELSYDKVASIIKQHSDKLNDRIALRALFNWAQSTPSVATTGSATANIAPPSGTGNRNRLALDDIAQAAAKLDEDDVPREGRYMMIPAVVYWDFIANVDKLLSKDYTDRANLPDGVVAKIFDFNIITRSYTTVYNGSDALKAVGAAAAATDQWGIVGWQMDEVARALGAIKVYSDIDDPVYQGNLYSATVRFNAVPMRNDDTGIVTILQDT